MKLIRPSLIVRGKTRECRLSVHILGEFFHKEFFHLSAQKIHTG